MKNFWLLKNIYDNLGESCRNRVLGNIFNILNVSATEFIIIENRVVFRIFADSVLHNYLLIEGIGINRINRVDRLVECRLYIDNDNFNFGFINQLIRCQDEYHFYCLLKQFL